MWNHLHQGAVAAPEGDVDVIWYDPDCTNAAEDRRLEDHLKTLEPAIAWSVKNQARMHRRNGDSPYTSATDAMRYWPETATAVAARRIGLDGCEIAAPYALDDLFNLVLRPTFRFRAEKRAAYEDRIRSKGWIGAWPLLTMA
ncbi:hypothetical protein EDF57_109131 [Novosphingobium sp. PhB55]|nr:hypothetical protein EDF57_109131 [Novosphingobium sp. PhB55]